MEQKIRYAYGLLSSATSEYHEATEQAIMARSALERAKLGGLASGAIEGKNAELREASARKQLAGLYAELETAEKEERSARLWLDLARLGVEEIRALLRLAEIQAKMTSDLED